MIKIKLPIKYHTPTTKELDKLGIESDEYTVKDMTFYSIDFIQPYLEDDICGIGSGGDTFICMMSARECEKLVDEFQKERFKLSSI